jgi:NAD(P)-dependent dehydrogenase (short-subunit alcohol dehydrogenase family)
MNDLFRLDNQIAVVTGGGTGLGLAIARRMAEAGARVVLVGRRQASTLTDAAGSDRGGGFGLLSMTCRDVATEGGLIGR